MFFAYYERTTIAQLFLFASIEEPFFMLPISISVNRKRNFINNVVKRHFEIEEVRAA